MAKKRYTARIKFTFNTVVEVEAESEEEAREAIKQGAWDDDGMPGAELCDWGDPVGLKEER